MSIIKKLCAIVCALAILMTFAGCHKKDEIAVTAGDVEFTSAYYMCAFVMADSQARSKVSEDLTEAEQSSGEIDYEKKKIDGKKYSDWVKDTALTELKKIAAYKTLCAKAKIELDKDEKSEAEQMVNYYWASYGYQSILEPNGVSLSTYKKYMLDSYYSTTYFEHLYGEGGEKEISSADIEKTMYESFELANMLNGSFTDSEGKALSDTAKAELKTKFEGYLSDITSGKRTFTEIYKEYNNIKDTEEGAEHDHEHEADEDTKEELKPLDEYASLLGNKDTDYASDHFETVQKMAVGEAKLVELEDKSGLVILVKKDIKADPYYKENLDLIVRKMIKGDEFDKEIEKFIKTIDFKENSYATGQFKVGKIVYPQSSY